MIKRDVKCSLFVVTVFDFVIVDSTTLGGQRYWTTRSLSFWIQVFSVAFPQVYEIKHLVVQWTWTNICEIVDRSKELTVVQHSTAIGSTTAIISGTKWQIMWSYRVSLWALRYIAHKSQQRSTASITAELQAPLTWTSAQTLYTKSFKAWVSLTEQLKQTVWPKQSLLFCPIYMATM